MRLLFFIVLGVVWSISWCSMAADGSDQHLSEDKHLEMTTSEALEEINRLGVTADECVQKQQKQRDLAEEMDAGTALSALNTRLNYELAACYKEIAFEIFDKFYPQKATQLKNSFEQYFDLVISFNIDLYRYNGACFYSCSDADNCTNKTCGTLAEELGSASAAKIIQDTTLRMLIYTKQRLKI